MAEAARKIAAPRAEAAGENGRFGLSCSTLKSGGLDWPPMKVSQM